MKTAEAAELAQLIQRKAEDFVKVCRGIDEATASRNPEGRWSPKEIVSHLCGPEGKGFISTISPFLELDTPLLELKAEDPFFSESRAQTTFADLLSAFEKHYAEMTALVASLSNEQLARKAHIPMLKESPLTEYPTLAAWIGVIGVHHLEMHINHLNEIIEELKTH